MAIDRFVYWDPKGKRPSRDLLGHIIEDYFGAAARDIVWNDDRFFIHLPGKTSHPFRRVPGAPDYPPSRPTRWIEVWPDGKCVDIITREADEFTNVVAAGLQRLLIRWYDATEEDPNDRSND